MKHLWMVVLALGLASAAGTTGAQTVTCASSWAAIATALGNTSGVGGEHEIRIVQGTYAMSGSVSVTPQASARVRLLGGYAAGCGSRTVDAGNTHISGQNLYQFHLLAVRGGVALDGLTVRNLVGGGLYLQGAAEANPSMQITHSVIRNSSGGGAGVAISSPRGNITVVNSVFANLSVTGSGCGLLLDAPYVQEGYGLGTGVNLIQTTVTNTHGAGGNAAACVLARRGSVYNNIFHANTPRDLEFAAENTVALRHNIVDGNYATPPYSGEANFDADPLFVNPAANNFDLQNSSPAINLSPLDPNVDYDLHGGTRLVGSAFDVGADESTLNDYSDVLVTNSNDDGAGSLRAAIVAANANANLSRIVFSIPGACGSQAILLLNELPDITAPLFIDGYSQPGAAQNTSALAFNADVCVSLNAISPATVSYGLRVAATAPSSVQVAVWGLGFGNFGSGGAIQLRGGSEHNLSGNQFAGSLPNGNTLSANVRNIFITQAASAIRVGGPGLWQRNLISGASSFDGIAVSNTDSFGPDITIENNLIGLNAARAAALGNAGAGISLLNTGGVTVIGNAIGGNAGPGIAISGGLSSSIRDNAIGASFTWPGFSVGNDHGITVSGGNVASVIGNSLYTSGGGNDIGGNAGVGVWIIDGGRVTIRGNRISDNGALGIDLGASQGLSPPDVGDGDTGPNGLQNHPYSDEAVAYSNETRVESRLYSHPDSEYVVDYYLSASCDGIWTHGEGENLIGSRVVTTGGQGSVFWSFTVPESLPVGSVITATATRRGPGLGGLGDTSEFSMCETVVAAPEIIFRNGFED